MFNITKNIFIFTLCILVLGVVIGIAYAGKLYIKPQLQINRANRLLEEAEDEFNWGKTHFALSPEVSASEFQSAAEKYNTAADILEEWGEGYAIPADIIDYRNKAKQGLEWYEKAVKRKGQ